jgi:hypothetical protein
MADFKVPKELVEQHARLLYANEMSRAPGPRHAKLPWEEAESYTQLEFREESEELLKGPLESYNELLLDKGASKGAMALTPGVVGYAQNESKFRVALLAAIDSVGEVESE